MENNQTTEMEFENNRLQQTIDLAEMQLAKARELNEKTKEDIIAAKQELRDNTSHSFANLYSSDDFEAMAELSQYADPITAKIEDYEAVEQKIVLLENLIKSPYFARIDFRFEDEDTFEHIYIGRTSLKKDTRSEPFVYDWRSPIASVFYRFVSGPAYYDAPSGQITGEVSLKRQYEIKNSVLEYYFDAEVQIVDDFLRKLLSQNTSSKMKTIVETIQKEQDIVIRDMATDLMMVQGVAGSGKTSIALHRAAYLMYQGLSARLNAENILIISPNSVFEQYISNVLPELGEHNVESVVFEEMAAAILRRQCIQPKTRFLENLISNTGYRDIIKNSIEFKTSRRFMELLDRFIDDLPYRWFAYEDITYKGEPIIGREAILDKVLSGKNELPLGTRLRLTGDYILEQISDSSRKRVKRQEKDQIREDMLRFLELDIEAAYRGLFADRDYFYSLAAGAELPACMDEIFEYTRENLDSQTIYYDDAVVLTYLNLKINGIDKYKTIKQVVIDEAQDYYPLHFEIFNLLFPTAKFTILGDINQTLEKREDLTLYEAIERIFKRRKSTLVTMNKSFRCTNEILNYSARFLDESLAVESFNRAGALPQVYALPERDAFREAIVAETQSCLAMGYQSVGLICKTEKNARWLYEFLKDKLEIQLVNSEETTDLQGVFVIPVYMSKGLEFDAVLIGDADSRNYCTDDDKKLLYISCTRALHRLNLFCVGEASPLL